MNEREALKLALEALQSGDYWKGVAAVNAIKEALAQPVRITWDERGVRTVNGVPDDAQPKQEPVAWYDQTNGVVSADKNDSRFTQLGQVLPLYPQRTWVGLMDEEIRKTCVDIHGGYEQARAIEAKLRSKNT
jgi:hypothetical protein